MQVSSLSWHLGKRTRETGERHRKKKLALMKKWRLAKGAKAIDGSAVCLECCVQAYFVPDRLIFKTRQARLNDLKHFLRNGSVQIVGKRPDGIGTGREYCLADCKRYICN